MRNIILITTISLLIGGCATATSSGAQRIGENLYTITASMDGVTFASEENSAKTRTKALKEASDFCSSKGGGYANVVKEEVSKGSTATAIVYFNCKQ